MEYLLVRHHETLITITDTYLILNRHMQPTHILSSQIGIWVGLCRGTFLTTTKTLFSLQSSTIL
ncbi:hypothetical protein VCR14J2_610306 [Vibrio coralliirubri]|nr:hypothetical protein VCR14J2_610306 [Vibrio coralliirubri]